MISICNPSDPVLMAWKHKFEGEIVLVEMIVEPGEQRPMINKIGRSSET